MGKLVAYMLVISLLHRTCDAFPTPHTHAYRHYAKYNAHQRVGDAFFNGITQDFPASTFESLDVKSKSPGFLTWLFRRRNRARGSQSAKLDHNHNIHKHVPTMNRLCKAVSHGIKSNTQLRISARSNKNDDTITSARKQISSTRQPNKFMRQHHKSKSSTSSINRIRRISKVQSFASSSTALGMVLSTPESIIEQVSTEKLLDILIDESVRTSSRDPIMMQFNPSRWWIWRQWRGTVFSETWKSGLLNMALATFVVFLYKLYPNLKDLLQGFSILWGQLLSVTTFTLTFFLNQSYGLWRKCYDYSRRLQGRLNDLGMTLAAHATRNSPSSPDIPSIYTPQSKQALELVSRYVRVFNLLTYASFTRSHRPILTPRGMRRLVERGILTQKEREILTDAEIPATQRHNAVLVWLIRIFLEGRQTGIFEGGYGFEEQFMEKCHVIRAQYGAIGDELQGRMPLAYAHIVQVLLDVVLWMYPFMALSTGMAWYIGVVGTGLLTMFYQGLFDLAKQFLDPYDNENYGKGEDPLVIDTLIAETNAGSVRWLNSFQQQPWSKQLLNAGEMYDSMLPVRGYSVEEVAEMKAREEAEQAEKERLIQEKRLNEENLERERAEDWLKENFASVQNGTISFVEHSNDGKVILSKRAEKAMSNNVMNKTLQLVSGGEVVSTSSFIPSSAINYTLSDSLDTDQPNTSQTNEILKILTLDDGTLVTPDESIVLNSTKTEVSFQSTQETTTSKVTASREATSTIKPWTQMGGRTPNYLENRVDNYLQSLSKDDTKYDVEDEIEQLDPFGIEWWKEKGPDGKEMRLSQMLADEDWEYLNEDDLQNRTMGYEEFAKRATDLIERTENEIAETKEILYSSPGRQAEYDPKTRRTASKSPNKKIPEEKKPAYDQTRLDSISQLWGAPPDVLGKTMLRNDEESRTINEDMDFANIYRLWGEPIEPKVSHKEEYMIAPSFEGIRQLWNDEAAPVDGDPTLESEAFAGLEWWDTVSEDGKEIRLSMMLADEEYEEEGLEDREDEPMTYEQFALETENMIQMVEDERKETEAIMKAAPGADAPSEFDEIIDESSSFSLENIAEVASSEEFDEMVMSLSQARSDSSGEDTLEDEDFSVLEMDLEDDKEGSSSSLGNITEPLVSHEREESNRN